MNLFKLRIKGKIVYVQHDGSITFKMSTATATAEDGTIYHDCSLVECMGELNQPKRIDNIGNQIKLPQEEQMSLFNAGENL